MVFQSYALYAHMSVFGNIAFPPRIAKEDPEATRKAVEAASGKLGITTVYVTHDQVEAMSLGERVALVGDGKLEQVGPPGELYERPARAFVARFIGSPPANILKASLEEENGKLYLRTGGKRLRLPDSAARPLAASEAGELLLGIRPEHIRIHPPPRRRRAIGCGRHQGCGAPRKGGPHPRHHGWRGPPLHEQRHEFRARPWRCIST